MTENTRMNDTIVYVDESGDHSLESIDPQYPIFTLVFCLFKISDYQKISLALDTFKVKYFGHSKIVLHEHDIRKNMHGEWAILGNEKTRENFYKDLTKVIEEGDFQIIATTINKKNLKDKYLMAQDPYELSLLFCMELLHEWLLQEGQRNIRMCFESRIKKFNTQLRKEFYRIRHNTPSVLRTSTDFKVIDYKMTFLDKKSNTNGLQIADLVARPIGSPYWKPKQANRAYEVIKDKILKHKVFP